MSLTATDKGGAEFAVTPENTYIGRCYRILDLGTQTTEGMFGSKEQHKVMVSFELFGEDEDGKPIVMEDGRPFSVSQFYTVSLHEKSKLRADLQAWRGKTFSEEELAGFDLSTVLGAYCMIQVIHDKTGKYANINSIMSYKGQKPAPVNENVIFDIDNPDMDVFNSLSENMQKKIMLAPEWNARATTKPEPTPAAEPTNVQIDDLGGEPVDLSTIPF